MRKLLCLGTAIALAFAAPACGGKKKAGDKKAGDKKAGDKKAGDKKAGDDKKAGPSVKTDKGVDLEKKIVELEALCSGNPDFDQELVALRAKAEQLQAEIFAELTPIQKLQLSRHPGRPYALDYIAELMDDFVELHGDRAFRDDPAIVGGLAWFEGREILIIAHQKGFALNRIALAALPRGNPAPRHDTNASNP